MGTEGDDFKCTAGIKMAFLIPRKSNKPHPLEIPLAAEALPHPPQHQRHHHPALNLSASVYTRVPLHVNQPLAGEDALHEECK